MTVKNISISSEHAGRRIDNFLMTILSNIPKSNIYKIIRKGEVRVNSKRIKPSFKLTEGDLVRIPPKINEHKKNNLNYDPNTLSKFSRNNPTIFEDKDCVILNKSSGIAVHGGTKNINGIIDYVQAMYDQYRQRSTPGSSLPWFNFKLCHRLDKNTSGCLVLAKNLDFLRHFQSQLKNRSILKKYHCIVQGKINREITIKSKISTKSKDKYFKVIDNEKGKESITKFKLIKDYGQNALIEAQIYTGRTHQIRLHLENIGLNLLNDNKYGDLSFKSEFNNKSLNRMGLHARELEFISLREKKIHVIAKYDEKFENLIKFASSN